MRHPFAGLTEAAPAPAGLTRRQVLGSMVFAGLVPAAVGAQILPLGPGGGQVVSQPHVPGRPLTTALGEAATTYAFNEEGGPLPVPGGIVPTAFGPGGEAGTVPRPRSTTLVAGEAGTLPTCAPYEAGVTTTVLGEEGSGSFPGTTFGANEEGGFPPAGGVTTTVYGEEGGLPISTSYFLGEEGARITTLMIGEEGGTPAPPSTRALGEE